MLGISFASAPDFVFCGTSERISLATAAAKLLLSDVPTKSGALAKEMSHDLEMNFNKIAPFGRR